MKKNNKKYLLIIAFLTMVGCKKLVEVNPPPSIIATSDVYSSDATAISAVTGIYTTLSFSAFGSNLSRYGALSADEFDMFLPQTQQFFNSYYQNALSATGNQDAGGEIWATLYPIVYRANAAYQGISSSSTLTPAIKQQLLGEVLFVRAFCYFHLVSFYGDVPLVLSTDYKVTDQQARTPQTQVYQQIITDLVSAKSLLSALFLDNKLNGSDQERVRPSKWVAAALLARVYLYSNQWEKAAAMADTLINNNSLFSLSSLNNTFLRAGLGNNEAIWQMPAIVLNINTNEGSGFIIPPTGPASGTCYLSPFLLKAFEQGDKRFSQWVNNFTDTTTTPHTVYYYPFKYKIPYGTGPVNEYETWFRLGEQYLIRAEAEANSSGGLAAAINDLNVIRSRAGLPNYSGSSSDQNSVLAAIRHERQVELFSEFGHRWLDLKRLGLVNSVMGSPGSVTFAKGGTWKPTDALYPLPYADLKADHNLTQNPGY